jgi:hypothetical protein
MSVLIGSRRITPVDDISPADGKAPMGTSTMTIAGIAVDDEMNNAIDATITNIASAASADFDS